MAAATGIWNHTMAAGQALKGVSATPMAGMSGTSSTDSSNDSSSDSSTISANDFLTLLVTEMQNQDPTADTDPNEYIDQLVQVNSLEQLISINQNVSTALGDSTSSSGSSTSSDASGATPGITGSNAATAHKGGGLGASQFGASSAATASTTTSRAFATKHIPGNLSVPEVNPAAQRVAHALDGRSHAQSITGRLPGAE